MLTKHTAMEIDLSKEMWQKSPLDVNGLILSWKHSYLFFFFIFQKKKNTPKNGTKQFESQANEILFSAEIR